MQPVYQTLRKKNSPDSTASALQKKKGYDIIQIKSPLRSLRDARNQKTGGLHSMKHCMIVRITDKSPTKLHDWEDYSSEHFPKMIPQLGQYTSLDCYYNTHTY